jgi:hypothetical protein
MADRGNIGGAKRDRTADLLVANEALSQLSYSPTSGNNPAILAAKPANADGERSTLLHSLLKVTEKRLQMSLGNLALRQCARSPAA